VAENGNINLQRRLADHFFAKAETWEDLAREHDRWLDRHNAQRHETHEDREDDWHSPSEVLGLARVVCHHPTDLSRAFFSTMLVRRLAASGYARVKHRRVYAEEGLARARSPSGWATARWPWSTRTRRSLATTSRSREARRGWKP
jgi:hypothetical protein